MALTEAAFARTINFDDPSVRKDKPPEYATLEQEKAWWKAYNEWNAKPKAAGGDSPFLDYTKGYNNIPSVSAYGQGNTPPHWTSLYGAIQSGASRITGNPEEGFSIVDKAGNPQSGTVEQVAPGVYSIKTGSGQYSANFVVGADPKTGYVSPITDMSKQYNSWRHDYSGGGLPGAVQGLTQGLMDLGPLGKIALAYGIAQTGGALGGALGIPAAAGAALASGGLQLAQGADLSDAIKSAATGALIGTAANAITSALPSLGTGDGLLSSGTTSLPTIGDTTLPPASDLYSLAPSTPTSGLGLQATMGEGTNLFSTGANVGTDALGTGLTLPDVPNLSSMGGGQGLTIPAAGGGLLGEAGVGNAVTAVTNPITGQPLGQELSNINTGVTDVTGTPIGTSTSTEDKVVKKLIEKAIGSTMADNTSNVAGGLLTSAGGAISGEAAKTANQAAADALKTATTAATTGATFRPVGITTRFGSSTYTYDPTTGQLTAAGYTPTALSDTLQTGAKSVYDLGSKYVAQSPEEAAKSWLTAQQNLLKPGQDVTLANLRNQLFQSGREGLSVAQGGDLMAANPELAAYYNSLANQNALLASQAQQFGQKQAEFGTGLLGSGLKLMGGVESLAQNPFDLSTKLATSVSGAGANAGRLNLAGTEAAQRFSVPAASYSPFGNLIAAAGSNPAFSSALGGLLTQYAPQLSNWWNSLSATPGGGGITSDFTLPDYGTDNFWSY